MSGVPPARDQGAIRKVLLVILAAGLLGTLAELVLLEHTEGIWQKAPLALLVGGLVSLGWHRIRPGRTALTAVRLVMILVLAGGPAGLLLHYRGNVEFELEMHPGASGLGLFWEAIRGATPALAPGTMMLFGALGLLYTFGDPGSGAKG